MSGRDMELADRHDACNPFKPLRLDLAAGCASNDAFISQKRVGPNDLHLVLGEVTRVEESGGVVGVQVSEK